MRCYNLQLNYLWLSRLFSWFFCSMQVHFLSLVSVPLHLFSSCLSILPPDSFYLCYQIHIFILSGFYWTAGSILQFEDWAVIGSPKRAAVPHCGHCAVLFDRFRALAVYWAGGAEKLERSSCVCTTGRHQNGSCAHIKYSSIGRSKLFHFNDSDNEKETARGHKGSRNPQFFSSLDRLQGGRLLQNTVFQPDSGCWCIAGNHLSQ